MVTRTTINTQISYFIIYTKLRNMKNFMYTNNFDTNENILDRIIKDFSKNNKLNQYPILAAISAVRNNWNIEIKYENKYFGRKFFKKELLERLDSLSIFRNIDF